jgi:hypothetical protein
LCRYKTLNPKPRNLKLVAIKKTVHASLGRSVGSYYPFPLKPKISYWQVEVKFRGKLLTALCDIYIYIINITLSSVVLSFLELTRYERKRRLK